MAPFVARRIWGREAFRVDLDRCAACGFVFFNPRLEPSEEKALYAGYRGPEYLRARHALEPWYTKTFNAGFTDPALLAKRKSVLAEILRVHLPTARNCRVLDFGGSHGQLVKDLLPNSKAYVYDISGVELLDGVIPCASLAECRRLEFDVVVCSNVLEHVGSPRAVMEQIMSIATPDTLAWIEVPRESPSSWKFILRRVAQDAILLALRPGAGMSILGPGMLHWMHEHVNYFTANSLQALLKSSGFHVLACDAYRSRAPLETMVWAMGKVADSRSL